jgi:hypothetical protein
VSELLIKISLRSREPSSLQLYYRSNGVNAHNFDVACIGMQVQMFPQHIIVYMHIQDGPSELIGAAFFTCNAYTNQLHL